MLNLYGKKFVIEISNASNYFKINSKCFKFSIIFRKYLYLFFVISIHVFEYNILKKLHFIPNFLGKS